MGRWSIEVFFKEAKTILGLGKDSSQSFQGQICAITLTFLRYNLLAFLKEQQAASRTTGDLFNQLEQEMAPLNIWTRSLHISVNFYWLAWTSCNVLAISQPISKGYQCHLLIQSMRYPYLRGAKL